MDIQVGDRVTYYFLGNERIYIEIVNDESKKVSLKQENVAILKIERPQWSVIEEKKEILTEEEINALQTMINILEEKIQSIECTEDEEHRQLIFYTQSHKSGYWYYIKSELFKGLKSGISYTLTELGLEE